MRTGYPNHLVKKCTCTHLRKYYLVIWQQGKLSIKLILLVRQNIQGPVYELPMTVSAVRQVCNAVERSQGITSIREPAGCGMLYLHRMSLVPNDVKERHFLSAASLRRESFCRFKEMLKQAALNGLLAFKKT